MAAIAPRTQFLTTALLLIFPGSPLLADRAAEVRSQISHIATSLASGNAEDAMEPFDKSFASYDKLSGHFQGLTVFQIENEVDVTDEDDTSDTETKVTVNWSITLTDLSTNRTDHRAADINMRLVLKDRKWKIVDFSPIDIFNPLAKWGSKP